MTRYRRYISNKVSKLNYLKYIGQQLLTFCYYYIQITDHNKEHDIVTSRCCEKWTIAINILSLIVIVILLGLLAVFIALLVNYISLIIII